ncbi:MAG: hypothetical protein EXQ77_01610 [Thermoleophilia bacterium]|nr:hypothetical protein [Thermoleophilia bacterium]
MKARCNERAVAWLLFAAVCAAVLATQAWPPWEQQLAGQYASDVHYSYERIAAAAPALPESGIDAPHAYRFAVHWALGAVTEPTDVRTAYRVATSLLLLLACALVLASARALQAPLRVQALAVGTLAASAYPARYLLAAPGMLSDALFTAGLAGACLGLVARRPALTAGALVVAVAGRQTALPVALALGLAYLVERAPWRTRLIRAAVVAVPAVAVYALLATVSARFAEFGDGLIEMSVLGEPGDLRALAGHAGRVALGVAIPAAILLGARRHALAASGPLLAGLVVALQALALAPGFAIGNEPRLAGLAAPALAVAVAAALTASPPGRTATVALATVLGAGSLHHLYASVGPTRNVEWAVLVAASTLVAGVATLRGR